MRALVLFFALVLQPLGIAAPAQWSAPAPVLKATHRLEAADGICSGTAIAPHALLTAHHCAFTTTVKVDGVDLGIKAVESDGNDHDILLVDGPAFVDVASFELSGPLQPGDDIWVRGNPAGLVQLVRRGVFAGEEASKSGVVNLYDYNGFFGDSGAAVFDSNGRIVDVIDAGIAIPGPTGSSIVLKLGIGYGLKFTPAQLANAQSMRFDG